MPKKRVRDKDGFDIADIDIPIEEGIKGVKSFAKSVAGAVFPSQKRRTERVKRKLERMRRKIELKKEELKLRKEIEALEREEKEQV